MCSIFLPLHFYCKIIYCTFVIHILRLYNIKWSNLLVFTLIYEEFLLLLLLLDLIY